MTKLKISFCVVAFLMSVCFVACSNNKAHIKQVIGTDGTIIEVQLSKQYKVTQILQLNEIPTGISTVKFNQTTYVMSLSNNELTIIKAY